LFEIISSDWNSKISFSLVLFFFDSVLWNLCNFFSPRRSARNYLLKRQPLTLCEYHPLDFLFLCFIFPVNFSLFIVFPYFLVRSERACLMSRNCRNFEIVTTEWNCEFFYVCVRVCACVYLGSHLLKHSYIRTIMSDIFKYIGTAASENVFFFVANIYGHMTCVCNVFVCVYAFAYACKCHMYTYIYIHIHIYICTFIFIYMYKFVYIYTYICIYIYIYTYMYVCIYACMYTCIYINVHICICIHIFIYLYIQI